MSIYLCGETGIINRGCEAIIRSTIKLLNKRSGDIYLATSAPEMDLALIKELGINMVHYNSFPTRYHRYYAAIMRKVKHSVDGKFLQAELFSHLSKEDLCLNIGGDTYCYGRPSISLELNNFTERSGINNILWCCSVEDSAMQGEVLDDLKKYRYIFAREKITYANLLKAGINKSNVIKCCDPAFFLDTTTVKLPSKFVVGNTVGINVSEMIVSEKYPNTYSSIVELISEILGKTEMTICLIPHVYSIEKNQCDWPILSRIYDEFHNDRICIVDREYNCEQLKYIISQCRFMIAARTHASIAAYSSEVPTMVLGYSIKSKGIAQDLFGTDEHFVVPNEEITSQRLSTDFWYIYNNENMIHERLHEVLPEYKQSLLSGIDKLNSLVRKSNSICDNNLCTGCQACRMVCPKDCISMVQKENGFLYPVIDNRVCISCGKCQKICPVANRYKDDGEVPECYVAINKGEDIRKNSSSGGVFSEVAKKIHSESGVVFGAVFNDRQELNIVSCETWEDTKKARGAKYVQADVRDIYIDVEEALMKGKKVLYTGTSCQIGGLYAFLGHDYKNLVTMDTICHGVPSPKAWKQYKESIEKENGSKIIDVSFRCKDTGWQVYSLKMTLENGTVVKEKVTENIYMQAFMSHLTIRPSCYECSYKQVHRQADITLGDFWGIKKWNPNLDDDKGVSIVFLHSGKAKDIWNEVKERFETFEVSFSDAIKDNRSYMHSCEPSPYQKLFLERWKKQTFSKAAKIFCDQTKMALNYRRVKLFTNWKWK